MPQILRSPGAGCRGNRGRDIIRDRGWTIHYSDDLAGNTWADLSNVRLSVAFGTDAAVGSPYMNIRSLA